MKADLTKDIQRDVMPNLQGVARRRRLPRRTTKSPVSNFSIEPRTPVAEQLTHSISKVISYLQDVRETLFALLQAPISPFARSRLDE